MLALLLLRLIPSVNFDRIYESFHLKRCLHCLRAAAAAASPHASGDDSDVSLSQLSKELVRAKMAEADLQRKLRVAARGEVDLHKRIADRDARVGQLKDQLLAKQRLVDELNRRPVSGGAGAGW